ncbi:putative ribonuclease H-like domain-containing protein, partial [Tanacetum coccineum]
VSQGYIKEEGIDYDEVFAPIARIEAIRLFLAYASFKDFMVNQMDVKSAFLYGKIEEEVYVCQPPGFEDLDFPDRVYKVEKALYGLHQAPRAWHKGDILLVQVYVDDIIFGSTKKELCNAFEKLMHEKFQMSSMGELAFFLGLQVQQKKDGIFISQDKYVCMCHVVNTNQSKGSHLHAVKRIFRKITRKVVRLKMEKLLEGELSQILPKTTTWNEFSSTMASAIICLAHNPKFTFAKFIFEDEAIHKELGDSLVRAATTASSLEAEQDSGNITKT